MDSERLFGYLYFLCEIGFIFGLIVFAYQRDWDMALIFLVLGAMILYGSYYKLKKRTGEKIKIDFGEELFQGAIEQGYLAPLGNCRCKVCGWAYMCSQLDNIQRLEEIVKEQEKK